MAPMNDFRSFCTSEQETSATVERKIKSALLLFFLVKENCKLNKSESRNIKSVIIYRKNKISNRKLEKMKPVGTRLFQDLMERQFLLVRNYMYMGSMRVVLGVKKQKAGSFFGALELCSIIGDNHTQGR